MKKRLDEWGISLARFQQMLVEAIQRRKFRARVADEDIDAYFEAHRADLDTIRAVVVRTASKAVAGARGACGGRAGALVAGCRNPVACDPRRRGPDERDPHGHGISVLPGAPRLRRRGWQRRPVRARRRVVLRGGPRTPPRDSRREDARSGATRHFRSLAG